MLYLDYKQCEQIIKKHSSSFYKAFSRVGDKHKRNAIYAVYAFCRTADDYIDEHNDAKALNRFEDEFTSFLEGQRKNTFIWNALSDVFKRYEMEHQPFYDMIEGQRMDQTIFDYQSYGELLTYCYRVASSVGLMITPILSPEHHTELENCSIKLGYAMQLTNILRDIGEDLKRGRVYIPTELMNEFGYLEEDLNKQVINNQFINLWEHLAMKAEAYYEEAATDYYLFPEDSRQSVALSALFYREILNACRRANYDVFSKKNYVTDREKLELYKRRNRD